jgi:hypothetical protein
MPDEQETTDTKGVVAWAIDHWVIVSALVLGIGWVFHAEISHQQQRVTEQRTLPEINAALDKITKKIEHDQLKKEHTAYLCRCGQIKDVVLCGTVGVMPSEIGTGHSASPRTPGGTPR